MDLKRFVSELKRRKVFRVAIGYLVAGWALAQGIAQVLPVFEISNSAIRLIVLLIIVGFPVALVLAWFFDITRYGIVRTPDRMEFVASAPPDYTVAVLPFADLSPERDHDYFADGIAEEIIAALAKIDQICVAARRSSFWFKDRQADVREVAAKLNVQHVVEGSVRRDGNRVRITAELISARDGFTMWSETYDREMQSIFAVQEEITCAIVDALKIKLAIAPSATTKPRNTDAYDVYLQGLFWSDKPGEEALRKSVELFERALELDPGFARASTGISKAWLWIADAYEAPLTAYPKVREAAVNALRIDHREAEAHVYLAEAKRILDWDVAGAESEYLQACEIDPKSTPSNYFIAAFYSALGDREKALNYLRRATVVDPASLWVNNFASELYRYFGLTDEAIAAGERALQLDPAFVYGEPLLAATYREMGRYDEAIALYERAQAVRGRAGFGLAITYARLNREEEARQVLQAAVSIRRYTPGDAIAHVHVALGAHDDAIRELQRACDERSSSLQMIGIAPEFIPLRKDERFLAILRRIGVDPAKAFTAAITDGWTESRPTGG